MRIRRLVFLVLKAVGFTSFISFLWVFNVYHSSRPNRRYPELGRLFPSNNHGSYVYLTAAEATGLNLLIGWFMLALVLAGILVAISGEDSREFTRDPSRSEKGAMAIAVICYLILIIFAGPSIAAFAVSHGIVLSWGS